jgi:enoyl-[acyl-carrier protein] reductase II
MLHTALCELLDVRHPIVQGGMGPNDTTELAIAVCRAGGLGTISSCPADDPYAATRQQIQRVKDGTDSPFAVNQVVKADDAAARVRAVLDARRADPAVRRRLKVVITSGGDPRTYAAALRESGLLHVHVVPTVYHAQKAVQAGCGAVIAEGYESGGHVAYEGVHTLVLVPAVVAAVPVPVIAAGGFCDGRGLAAALALGAVGIQMGSRFYLSAEADFAHPRIKAALLGARETETVVVPGVYGPNRRWRNAHAEGLLRRLAAGAPHEEIERLKDEGEAAKLRGDAAGAGVPIGMVVGRLDHVPSVGDVVERVVAEAEQIVGSLQAVIRRRPAPAGPAEGVPLAADH